MDVAKARAKRVERRQMEDQIRAQITEEVTAKFEKDFEARVHQVAKQMMDAVMANAFKTALSAQEVT